MQIEFLRLCGSYLHWQGDSAVSNQLGFQEPATTAMEGIVLFNFHLLFVIISIVVFVGWLLLVVLTNFSEMSNSSAKEFNHSTVLEIIWTCVPTFILLSLAYPSFSLLYSFDEIVAPHLTFKILGHQWFWSYESSDFNSCSTQQNLKFSCYMLTDEYLQKNSAGFFRLLETNKRVVLPTNTHLRLLITSVDVLHSWSIPSFGVKVDACPGRLNQANLFIKRFGLFFGQCSEICGVNHGFMPVAVLAVPSSQFYTIMMANLRSSY